MLFNIHPGFSQIGSGKKLIVIQLCFPMYGKKISNRDIYIKLKIAEVGAAKIAKCISFHFAERPLRYPFKK